MEFKFYNPDKLVPLFRERGFMPYFYLPCNGCVFTGVLPSDCIHPRDNFKTPSVQSDMFCPHCYETIEGSKERFVLHEDKDLPMKVAELEEIIEMASKK